jgi:hypothetical protein
LAPIVLARHQYLNPGCTRSNLASYFKSINVRHAYVEQNEVWLKGFGLLQRFYPIGGLPANGVQRIK